MNASVEFLYSKFLQSDGVSTDTRTLKSGEMFFALSGPNFKGVEFAEKALHAGASCSVIDDPTYAYADRVIVVEDTLKALQELATFHRDRFKRPVLALTGSNGKTTTKELIARVLATKYETHATKGNLNNQIGVPLTLLDIHPQVEVAVIEMGASKVGDIAELCSFAKPTHGLITNIGRAHTETFGGIEGVLRGKSELFDFLRENGGVPFVNMSDSRLAPMKNRFKEYEVYPQEDLELLEAEPFVAFDMEGRRQTQMIGAFNFPNIAAAFAVGRFFEVPDADIVKAISSYVPSDRRSQVIKKDRVEIIVDAYNANPDSMLAVLDTFQNMPGEKTVVLGDMLELEDPAADHAQLGEWLSKSKIDRILLVGPLMKAAAERIPNSQHFETREDLLARISRIEFNGGKVLLKGSRKLALEQLVPHIN